MTHPLDGIQAKYDRAIEQFDELRTEMEAFFNGEPKPYFSVGEFDTDAWEWVERWQIREEPPPRFGVILGDSIHNLRSALDHLMWQVTLLDGGIPNNQTQFPIIKESETKFDAEANRRIPDLSSKHRALVKRAQPYHEGDKAALHPLAVLNELSNADKHRILNVTYQVVPDMRETVERLIQKIENSDPSPVRGIFVAEKGTRLEDGTPWLRIPWHREEEPPRSVNVVGQIALPIAFGDMGLAAEEMARLAEVVVRICQWFAGEFLQP